MKHSQEETSESLLMESTKEFTTRRVLGLSDAAIRVLFKEHIPRSNEFSIVRIIRLCGLPRHATEAKSETDNGT